MGDPVQAGGDRGARGGVAVIVPAFNEAAAIGHFLAELVPAMEAIGAEIIVVDDHSTDDTAVIAAAAGARVIRQPRNRGYGAALKRGIKATEAEYVLTIDADGQHRVADALRLLELRGQHDMVSGHRSQLMHSPAWRMPGKWLLQALARKLLGRPVPDLNCGLRVLRRDVVARYIHVCPNGFSFSTTTTMALLSRDYDVQFVPIEVERRQGTSTVTAATGFQTIMLVLRLACLFEPLRVYLPAAGTMTGLGLLWAVPYLLMGNGISIGALLLLMTGALLFAMGLLLDQISSMRLERFE